MSTNPKYFRELYLLLQTLVPASCHAQMQELGRLTASGKPSVQYRCKPRPDGSVSLTLARLDKSEGQHRPAPNPLIQFIMFPKTSAAEVARLVHNSDYVLEPLADPRRARTLVMRVTVAYARRWLRRLVVEGYRAVQPASAAKKEEQPPCVDRDTIPRKMRRVSASLTHE
jgi:hypothetical protein